MVVQRRENTVVINTKVNASREKTIVIPYAYSLDHNPNPTPSAWGLGRHSLSKCRFSISKSIVSVCAGTRGAAVWFVWPRHAGYRLRTSHLPEPLHIWSEFHYIDHSLYLQLASHFVLPALYRTLLFVTGSIFALTLSIWPLLVCELGYAALGL